MPKLETKENNKIKGRFVIRTFPVGTIDVLNRRLAAAKDSLFDRRKIMGFIRHGKIAAVADNLVMQGVGTGFALLAGWLIGDYTYGLGINYGAIGTGQTAAVITDTQLTTEYARALVSFSQVISNNEALVQFFFPDATLSNQTYYEAGAFVAATATPNSGQIFDHALLTSPYIKSAGVDTILELDITFSQ